MKYKVVIWGLGRNYNNALGQIRSLENSGQIEVLAVTAKNVPLCSKVDGYRIVYPENITELYFDYVIIFTSKYFNEIVSSVTGEYRIPREKIIKGSVLMLPNFCFADYVKLLERRISIMCCNCWGGILYNTLGMECRSPFKNMALSPLGLMKIMKDPRGYFAKEPELIEWNIDPHSLIRYPVCLLGDVRLDFNHDTELQSALDKWHRRVRLINYNELFVSIYTDNEEVGEQFDKLTEYEKKVCFVPFEPRNESEARLYMISGQKELWEAVNSSASQSGLECDPIKLLSDGIVRGRCE